MAIDVLFLNEQAQGNPQSTQVTHQLAEFITAAKVRLRIAAYHFHFKDEALAKPIREALRDRAAKGVEIQIAYYYEHSRDHFSNGGGPRPTGTEAFLQDLIQGTTIAIKPIQGSHLMHNKYVLRDGHTDNAAVWTGSTNFTDGAFKFMENNIVIVKSPQLSSYYENDFSELWHTATVAGTGTGVHDFGTAHVSGIPIDVYFSPGKGNAMDAEIVKFLRNAHKRIKISSMVLSSFTILAALSEAIDHDQVKDFAGIYDGPQMKGILKDWDKSATGATRKAAFEHVASKMVAKPSRTFNPKQPDADYNYMHNKIAVCDDVVITGSFNFSRNAEGNAENLLVIHSPTWANKFSEYIDHLVKTYGS